jgi:hypothetical protein
VGGVLLSLLLTGLGPTWLGVIADPSSRAEPPLESVVVDRSRGMSEWVPTGVDLSGPRCCHGCCQMRTLSKSREGWLHQPG